MSKLCPVILGFILFIHTVNAQQNVADSLERELDTLQDNKLKLAILNQLSFALREIDLEGALSYAYEAVQLAQSMNDSMALGRAYSNIGWINYRKGDWEKAFRYSKDAFTISYKLNDKEETARVLNNLGSLYYQQQDYEKAIAQFKLAYQISDANNDTYTAIRSLNNIAFNYSKAGQLDSALYYANRVIEYKTKSGSIYLTSFATRVIGDVQLEQGKFKEAISTYRSSLEMARQSGTFSFEASILHRLGNAYLLDGNVLSAIFYLEEGVRLSTEKGFTDELVWAYKHLAMAYEQLGEIEKAFGSQKKYIALLDSIDVTGTKNRLALIQGMFEADRKEAELRALQSEFALAEEQMSRKDLVMSFILMSSIVFLVLLLWIITINRRRKLANTKLIEKQIQINKQNEVLADQTNRLAELNQMKDQLLSILSHDLRGPIGSLKRVLDLFGQEGISSEELQRIAKMMQANIDGLYLTLDNLLNWSASQMDGYKQIPENLSISKLIALNLEFFTGTLAEKNVFIENLVPEGEKFWADKNQTEIIIRNLLSNAIKFSEKGEKIILSYQEKGNLQCLSISDFGVGIPHEKLHELKSALIKETRFGTHNERGMGMGLTLCHKFARLNGGEIQIESEAGKGSTFTLCLPKGSAP
jgi:signal transduction histidine kinase/Flp pilus assembly protein TadD